jgi:hypothetical protein
MKAKTAITILVLAVFTTSILGCGTVPEEHKGAAVGAGAGALAGVLLGGSTGGRVVGGLIGALVGGAIGHYAYDKQKTRDETAKAYNYQPSQGTQVIIENAQVSPQAIRGGEDVNLGTTYAVLTPSEGSQVDVTEIRRITHNGELVGNPQVTVARTGGTYTSSVPLRLPQDAKKGTYVVTTTIETAAAKDSRETRFSVQ